MDAAKLLIPVKRYVNLAGKFCWPVHKNLSSIRISSDSRFESQDAYRIMILPDSIEITAASDAGAYYAIQTLMDLIALENGNLHCCKIEDWPDFARRGVYLDCSRGKVPKLDTLKELVSRLAHWKINELQLYIENVFTFKRHPAIGRGYSPFTSDEILTLQDYCKLHHVRLVGSLASFGHMEKILMLPEYQHLGELPGFRGFAGGTTLCPTDPGSIKLIRELYEEFVPLFEAVDFNVCGDEPWELGKGRSKKSAQRIGVGRVYLNYFMKLYRLCQKHNKRMNAWADIVLEHPELLKEIPKDVVMLNWDYNIGGERVSRTKEIAKANLPFMVCPGTSSWNTHGTRLANAMGNVAEFAAQGLRYGAEGLLNTDWGDNGHRNFLGVSLHGFAHGAAHSWNSKGVDDKTFTQRFCKSVFDQAPKGQAGSKLAKALELLGSTYLTCSAPYRNESALFYTLIEPMKNNKVITPSRIDATTENGLKTIVSQLCDDSIWPAPKGPAAVKGLGEFERLTLRELKTAAQMDCLAAQRALAAKKIRSGKNITAGQSRKIGHQMHKIAKDFQTLWLARNKPSRLRDNLKLFRCVEDESLKLSRK